jgi:ABC-type Na+ efflux pump permease subunit
LAVKRRKRRPFFRLRSHGDLQTLSSLLAPPEEQKRRTQEAKNVVIKVNEENAKTPDDSSYSLMPHPVIVVIVLIALSFITFIAWSISQMEPK